MDIYYFWRIIRNMRNMEIMSEYKFQNVGYNE